MLIDKTTKALSGLVPEDIGKSVEDVLITCRVVLYRQEGKSFQAFVCDNDISCSSNLALQFTPGVTYKVSGKIGEFRGKAQLTVTAAEHIKNDDFAYSVRVNFLVGFFEDKGITKRMADKIVTQFGEGFVEKLMNCPDDVAIAVKGLSQEKANAVGEELVINKKGYKRYLDLMMAGLSAKQAKECDRKLDITPDDIIKNPFCLTVLDSFTFEDCDVISGGKDIYPLDKFRVYGAIKSVLNKLHAGTSSTYFEVPEVENAVRKMVVATGAGKDITAMFPSAFEDGCSLASENGTVSVYRFDNNKCIGCSVRDEGARIALKPASRKRSNASSERSLSSHLTSSLRRLLMNLRRNVVLFWMGSRRRRSAFVCTARSQS